MRNPNVARGGCAALNNLSLPAAAPPAAAPPASAPPAAAPPAAPPAEVSLVKAPLSAHEADEGVAIAGCMAISNMAPARGDAEACRLVLGALSRHRAAAVMGLRAVARLCVPCPENSLHFGDGGCDAITELLRGCGRDVAVPALMAVNSMAAQHRERMLESGVDSLIAEILHRYGEDADVCACACAALENLCSVGRDAVAAVLDVLDAHPADQRISYLGCSALGRSAECPGGLLRRGADEGLLRRACRAVTAVLRRHKAGAVADSAMYAANALDALATTP